MRLYRPSNGDEARTFQAHYCDRCVHDREFRENTADTGCNLIARAMVFQVEEKGFPTEWRYDAAGNPVCTKFRDVNDDNGNPRHEKPSDPQQLVMIADPTEDANHFTNPPLSVSFVESISRPLNTKEKTG